MIPLKDCGGVIFKSDTEQFYLRKQKACFKNKPGGASFIKPRSCTTDCDSQIKNSFHGEICFEIHVKEDKDRLHVQGSTD